MPETTPGASFDASSILLPPQGGKMDLYMHSADAQETTGPDGYAQYFAGQLALHYLPGLREEIDSKDSQIDWLKRDELTNELIRKGLLHDLMHKPGLLEEFLAPFREQSAESGEEELLPWGVIWLDIRGVKAMNDMLNTAVGDDFILNGMTRIGNVLTETSRQRERRSDEPAPVRVDERASERRTVETRYPDIIVRWGGDEVVIIARQVNRQALKAMSRRLAAQFTVDKADERYAEGQLPMIVGVGSASVVDIVPEINGESLQAEGMFRVIQELCRRADMAQQEVKKQQYDRMWDTLVDTRPDLAIIGKPDDERKIMQLYINTFFPDFAQRPYDFMPQRITAPKPES